MIMLDDFRDEANASPYFVDETEEFYEDYAVPPQRSRFLGMTAEQRLILAILLMLMVCIVGSLFLLVFGRVVPPAML
jgi:hypothetical protein